MSKKIYCKYCEYIQIYDGQPKNSFNCENENNLLKNTESNFYEEKIKIAHISCSI
jgi:hypothetical protein